MYFKLKKTFSFVYFSRSVLGGDIVWPGNGASNRVGQSRISGLRFHAAEEKYQQKLNNKAVGKHKLSFSLQTCVGNMFSARDGFRNSLCSF